MKHYPHMPRVHDYIGQKCIAFDKLDGSNIRAQWSPKQGWYQFALRGGGMIDPRDPVFGQAIDLFQQEYGESLIRAIQGYKPFAAYCKRDVMAFCEFFGPHTFAGLHDDIWLRNNKCMADDQANEPKQVVLFDINIFKKGIVGPEDFLASCGHLKIPKVVYEGVLDDDFIKDVRAGTVPGMSDEGVVCKGGSGFDHTLWSCKIKSTAYIDRLKEVFGVGWEKYGE